MATTRAVAANIIRATLEDGESLAQSLPAGVASLPERDRSLLQQLCYGTLRFQPQLQGLIRQLLQKPLKPRDADIHALLLLGAHQLLHMRTPDHAAISATVDACRELKKPWATKLVNGVLRRLSRESDDLLAKLSDHEAHAHPKWLYDALRSAWPDDWQRIVTANNEQPPMCLRVNTSKQQREHYLNKLSDAGIAAQACELSPAGIRLIRAVDVNILPGFESGEVSVQDEAAQLAAYLLAPAAGNRVLDACSAPGGKTGHLLEMQPLLGELVAMDNDPSRLSRVSDNLQRLGLSARTLEGDAGDPGSLGQFDRILVDAPCSGTGVIRRHPDIKALRRAADIKRFAATQLRILTASWQLLRPGGLLLYATCSVLPQENQLLVRQFLAENADAESRPLPAALGLSCDPGLALLPTPGGPDGLYYALLARA